MESILVEFLESLRLCGTRHVSSAGRPEVSLVAPLLFKQDVNSPRTPHGFSTTVMFC
jgi:hypothetical protein